MIIMKTLSQLLPNQFKKHHPWYKDYLVVSKSQLNCK